MSNDTICAIATAPGRGSIGVLRVSGEDLAGMARSLTGVEPKPRNAHFCEFRGENGAILDHGIALFFPAPNSFTGEDVLELQGHGGRVVLESLREHVIALGARQARPGEFSERAFLNGKIDLVQAEAIADLIDADSRQAARSALRTLTGEFSQRIQSITALLTQLRVLVESAIDFSDSDIEVLQTEQLRQSLADLLNRLDAIRERSRQGALLNQGISVVLAGLPNAGKSSLMNRLSGQQTAIVTEIPGTTRDVLSQRILLDDLPLQLIDTAGLRRSADVIEREGVRRAREAIESADVILLVIDASLFPDCAPGLTANELRHALEPLDDFLENEEDRADLLRRTCIALNKIDLLPIAPAAEQAGLEDIDLPVVRISAKDGSGMDLLTAHLKQFVAWEGGEDAFVARARHLEAIDEARRQCHSAMEKSAAQAALELIAEDLRLAQSALGRITGEVTSDDLLGEIFSKFCIGK